MNREDLSGLVGHRVAVGLNSAEGGGVEIYATLDSVIEDGIVLSQVTELGPGPTLFCPCHTFRRDRERPLWFVPPGLEPRQGEVMQIREQPAEEDLPQDEILPESISRERAPSARTLERVVPVAQKVTVDGVTGAIASLELYGECLGILRWLVSFERSPYEGDRGIFMPDLEIRDDNGRVLPWAPWGASTSDGEIDGEVRVEELPGAGGLEITVQRLVSDDYGESRDEGPTHEGPWNFWFSL